MSGEVVSLRPGPKDSDYIMVCKCGCATFTLRGDGAYLCRGCDEEITSDAHTFRFNIGNMAETDGPPVFTEAGNSPEFTERLAKRHAAAPDVTWLVCGNEAGQVRSWVREVMSQEQFEWLKRQVDSGVALLAADVES